MNYYKILIQYLGTNYVGFQWQSHLNTIQSVLNACIANLTQRKFSTMPSSRTDKGVHAIGQVVKLTIDEQISCDFFLLELNKLLPQDIKILEISPCPSSFKPTSDTLSKEYRYLFTNDKIPITENHNLIANITNPLNIQLIQECIILIKGTQNFQNFYSKGSNVKSTIRVINSCELNVINSQFFFNEKLRIEIPTTARICFEFKIIANGFLKQMIRHLVSALWMVGSEKMTIEEFKKLLTGPFIAHQKWRIAPPSGLYLVKINFKDI